MLTTLSILEVFCFVPSGTNPLYAVVQHYSWNFINVKISAILTTYDRADMVVEALESVLSQQHMPDEIIVVDDGSTDESLNRLQPYKKQIKVITQKNAGISAARNTGINAAQHDWITFLDSDDLWKPGKLKLQKQELEQNPEYKICYTNEEWRKNGKWMNQKKVHQKHSGWIYDKCLPLCIISPSSVVIHRSVFERTGLFDENLPACEDYDLWLRITALYPVLYIDEKLIIKRAGDWPQLSKQHSLDKYRIVALEKIIKSDKLNTEQLEQTRNMLKYKCNIYKLGCEKHNKADEIEWIKTIQRRFNLK